MITELSQIQIGQRIAALRKAKGLSQQNLAESIKLSRPSLAQIELGNRCIDLLEFYRLSVVLEFSLDDFMSDSFSSDKSTTIQTKIEKKEPAERNSIPVLNVGKFTNVLLYIMERCAGKPNVGETVLYKLLYFCDFNYYELYEEHLTGATYRKLPYGPVPKEFETIIGQMTGDKQIQRIKTEYFNKIQTRYIPLVKADLTGLKAIEKEVIDKVIDQMGDWAATTISDYSHLDKPWKATEPNNNIDYELAFYRRSPHSVRKYEEDDQGEI